MIQFISRSAQGTPIVLPTNDLTGSMLGTRYRRRRSSRPVAEVNGVEMEPHVLHSFTRRRIPFQRAESPMNPIHAVAKHIHTPANNIMFEGLNDYMNHATALHSTPLIREPPDSSSIAVNHAISQMFGTMGYITKQGETINPRMMRFEHLGRSFESAAREVKVLMYKNRNILPEDRDRALFLLNLMSVYDGQATLRLMTEMSEVMREKERRQDEREAREIERERRRIEQERMNIAQGIRARPITLGNRARTLGRRIKRGIQRRLGTRASRNSNSNSNSNNE